MWFLRSALAAVAVLTTTATAAAESLVLHGEAGTLGEATITLNHIQGTGTLDQSVVTTAFMNAYNGMHHRITIKDMFVEDTTILPDHAAKDALLKDAVNQATYYTAILSTGFEYHELGLMEIGEAPANIATTSAQQNHENLMSEFESNLHASGNAAFEHVQVARIDFTETSPPLPALLHDHKKTPFESTTLFELDYVAIPQDGISAKAIAALPACLMTSFNRVHHHRDKDVDWEMTEAHLELLYETEDHGAVLQHNANRRSLRRRTGVRGRQRDRGTGCGSFCGERLQKNVTPLTEEEVKMIGSMDDSRAVEVLFAHCLRNTFLMEFQGISNAILKTVTDKFDGEGNIAAAASASAADPAALPDAVAAVSE